MRFLWRFFIVLVVAVGLGLALYYAVQALPDDPPRFNRPGVESGFGNENGPRPENPESRPERPERDRDGGFSLRSLVGVAGRVVLFSVLVFGAVLGKHFLFDKRPNGKKPKES